MLNKYTNIHLQMSNGKSMREQHRPQSQTLNIHASDAGRNRSEDRCEVLLLEWREGMVGGSLAHWG